MLFIDICRIIMPCCFPGSEDDLHDLIEINMQVTVGTQTEPGTAQEVDVPGTINDITVQMSCSDSDWVDLA